MKLGCFPVLWKTEALYYLSIGLFVLDKLALGVNGHVAAWHKGMYCLNGTISGVDDQDTNSAVQPLYQLNKTDWWMHHFNGCDQFPPAAGDFLELPVNGEFTVELAVNRAFTTFSYDGTRVGTFGDGQEHPGLGVTLEGKDNATACITNPNIHTQNETMAAGTIFAISYTSDITQVTEDNLVVFTVLPNTPWKRLATYKVPNLPVCPDDGCICTWGWVPNGCGEPNMYMQPFRCKVTGQTGTQPVSRATAPMWCEGNQSQCIAGAKQMVFYGQIEGNNVDISGLDSTGQPKAPTYDTRMGFTSGAQTDIFQADATVSSTYIPPAPTSSSESGLRITKVNVLSWALAAVMFAFL
ncbi:hypothetical protein BDN70DRAFT_881859 [Pholiota conissans]|uniref:Uncharacterized protein n=1 Tax=Pholiota conissans TaxID=109636 RepID=A0A9P5YW83_9AGAR|nr:hypothetical protein BDN70DRAFT_881859 [Pholiota conissans]